MAHTPGPVGGHIKAERGWHGGTNARPRANPGGKPPSVTGRQTTCVRLNSGDPALRMVCHATSPHTPANCTARRRRCFTYNASSLRCGATRRRRTAALCGRCQAASAQQANKPASQSLRGVLSMRCFEACGCCSIGSTWVGPLQYLLRSCCAASGLGRRGTCAALCYADSTTFEPTWPGTLTLTRAAPLCLHPPPAPRVWPITTNRSRSV